MESNGHVALRTNEKGRRTIGSITDDRESDGSLVTKGGFDNDCRSGGEPYCGKICSQQTDRLKGKMRGGGEPEGGRGYREWNRG